MPWFIIVILSLALPALAAPAQAQQATNGTVVAHGEGYDMSSMWDARGAALAALEEHKAEIEENLPSASRIEWGQMRGTEVSTWSHYGYRITQNGTLVGPNCFAELQALQNALREVEQQLREELDIRGWAGNLTGGAMCNEVHFYIQARLSQIEASLGGNLQCYDLASMFDSGSLPNDYLAHVYLGVIDRQTGEVLYVLDPWRYAGSCDLIPYDEDPNGGDPEDVVPWGVCEPDPGDDWTDEEAEECADEASGDGDIGASP